MQFYLLVCEFHISPGIVVKASRAGLVDAEEFRTKLDVLQKAVQEFSADKGVEPEDLCVIYFDVSDNQIS
jgi:hypothetical protein